MLITVQPDPNWQLSLAQLSPSLFCFIVILTILYAKFTEQKIPEKNISVFFYLIHEQISNISLVIGWYALFIILYAYTSFILVLK